jgi:hypothetical protein
MTKSFVLETNIEQIILNYTCSNCWHGESVIKGINRSVEHYSKDQYLENDISREDIKQYIINKIKLYAENITELEKALKKLKFSWMKRKTIDFFIEHELPFKTASDWQIYINNNLLIDLQ